ncbi:unnamed protein product, partial [Symbiodinium sp. KB8]
ITWLRLYGQHVASAHLADQLWIRRYVDNRTIIVDKDALHNNPYIWQLASLQFYKKPVQLEDENCDDFLGFRINANNRQVYNQPGSTNVLVPLSSFRRGELWIGVLEFDPLTKHATCPWKAPEIIAYTILEVTFDLRTLVHLAQTNKATWIRCSQVLRATSTECKIQANAPWHKRAGRAVDGNAMETPIDIKMYLFNKRMHTWYHHELSYQQYMDLQASVTVRHVFSCPVSYHSHMVSVAATTLPETMDAAVPTTPPSDSSTFDYSDDGRHDAAEQVLTNATLLKTILKFHTELRVRTVAVSVEHTPIARHANQAVQSAMDAIVQQHPQAHHTTVIREMCSSSGYYGS